ncbi:DUF4192 family protein [Agromyces aerolatus]|uniref:DUF4192 family protein n=1 Tax=Agromyces sp. LY-1074 TaxID=3074080 RepID=UPI0028594DFB|nr:MULTISPECIES: DUF4192 family protein [unclassified Agromyces]MDR5701298.1 DUF4192 family protein [Agromyces sp. LY-1074]MDR5707556.1 DUF4192 family protein [Agromyces sp. LY-1358]
MNSPIRIASAQDLLALTPVLAGYRPERSLVCLAFREDRVAGVLRYDLPTAIPEREPLVSAAIGVLCRIPDIEGLVVVTYSDARFRSRAAAGERALLRLLMRQARQAGFATRDAIRVACDAWGSLLDPETPADGHPLELIESSSVLQHPSIAGRAPGAIDDGTALPQIADAEVELVRTALRELEAEYGAAAGAEGARSRSWPEHEAELRTAQPVDLVESLLARTPATPPTDDDVVRLAWFARLAAVPVSRDAMMLQIAFGPRVGRTALADVPEPVGGAHLALGRMLLGETCERPDDERVRRGREVLLRTAASAPPRERAGLLCMASWLVWATGRGTAASTLLDASLAADPGHAMAQLLHRYFATGALPEWLFERRSARADAQREAPATPGEPTTSHTPSEPGAPDPLAPMHPVSGRRTAR